jgi:CRISPR-associated protein Cas5d
MEKANRVEFKVYGKRALFTDPITKMGGEKFSYPIPTYQSLKGIAESIYWKPTIVWLIERVRVVNSIENETQNVRTIKYHENKNDRSIYSYLSNVEYQVQASFDWNRHRKELVGDQNENKHFFSAKRMIERGGRRDIFLGTRECQGYVEPCRFGEGAGDYDGCGNIPFGLMFHGFDYPDETGKPGLHARFWTPVMSDGVVEFIRPEDCKIRRYVKAMTSNPIKANIDDGGAGDTC